jgi:hypothetical protein
MFYLEACISGHRPRFVNPIYPFIEENIMGYQLEGQLLEVCTCNVLCPCWIGEAADGGSCEGVVAYAIDKGTIAGVDVSGRKIVIVSHFVGSPLQGNWKLILVVDDHASAEQQEALVQVWTGKAGGPVADLAQLYGEVVAVERTPITFTAIDGKGLLRIGDGVAPLVDAELAPYMGATGQPTRLLDTVFSTIPGSPAYVGKAATYRRNTSRYGLKDVNLTNHNAIQGTFYFEG